MVVDVVNVVNDVFVSLLYYTLMPEENDTGISFPWLRCQCRFSVEKINNPELEISILLYLHENRPIGGAPYIGHTLGP